MASPPAKLKAGFGQDSRATPEPGDIKGVLHGRQDALASLPTLACPHDVADNADP